MMIWLMQREWGMVENDGKSIGMVEVPRGYADSAVRAPRERSVWLIPGYSGIN